MSGGRRRGGRKPAGRPDRHAARWYRGHPDGRLGRRECGWIWRTAAAAGLAGWLAGGRAGAAVGAAIGVLAHLGTWPAVIRACHAGWRLHAFANRCRAHQDAEEEERRAFRKVFGRRMQEQAFVAWLRSARVKDIVYMIKWQRPQLHGLADDTGEAPQDDRDSHEREETRIASAYAVAQRSLENDRTCDPGRVRDLRASLARERETVFATIGGKRRYGATGRADREGAA